MRFLLALCFPMAAAAQDVALIPYDPLTEELARIVDFEEFDRFLSPGTRLEGVQDFGNLRAGERFFGQFTEQRDGFDRLAGLPSGPLQLLPGREFENLAVTFYFMITNHLVGHAAPGYPENRAGGEGAIALMFDTDQKAIGFRVAAEPKPDDPAIPQGEMEVGFYARDGRLIDRVQVTLGWGRQGYGFARANGVADIAGITIENRDPAGIAIDDIIFDVEAPSS